jgi:predicted ArsR family transcriptional regulator
MDQRERLLEQLRHTPAGLDAHELGRRLRLHPNTVRWHLGVLADRGAVESTPAKRSGRGRPRIVYRFRAGAGRAGGDEYRLLATILSGTLAASEGGARAAESTGRCWGSYLVERPLPLVDVDATATVAALLSDRGFDPETGDGEIRMRRCPFHDLAEAQPEIVCAVHRGLIDGALDELGSELRVEALDVFVEPDLCIARLGPSGRVPSA